MSVETTKSIIPIECDGLPEKPELPPGYDARETEEFQACMAEEATELLAVFDQIVELAERRGDIPARPTTTY